MRSTRKYRMLCSALAVSAALLAVKANATPTYIYESGALTGVKGIIINDRSFNVDFLEGPCRSALRCDNTGFRFKDSGTAYAAASALANQVFEGSEFNPVIPGCEFGGDCWFFTPYSVEGDMVNSVAFHNAINMPDHIELQQIGISQEFSNVTFARWAPEVRDPEPGSGVPEPGSVALFSVAIAGLAFARRKG